MVAKAGLLERLTIILVAKDKCMTKAIPTVVVSNYLEYS